MQRKNILTHKSQLLWFINVMVAIKQKSINAKYLCAQCSDAYVFLLKSYDCVSGDGGGIRVWIFFLCIFFNVYFICIKPLLYVRFIHVHVHIFFPFRFYHQVKIKKRE